MAVLIINNLSFIAWLTYIENFFVLSLKNFLVFS